MNQTISRLALHRAEWTSGQRHGAMVLICLAAFFNLLDRQIMSILIEPIKKDFGASDAAMGFLAGSAFAVFYAIASIPLARISDRHPRNLLIAVSLGAWSVMTMVGGFAGNFVQLALTRVGVAVGEAGSGPASYTLAADLYPLRHRGKAVAVYAASTSVGIGLAVMLGGWLVGQFGWRGTLIIIGAPGVLLALMILFLLKEPPRGLSDPIAAGQADASYGFWQVMRYLWQLRSYRCIVLIAACGGGAGFGSLLWGPTFMIRVHHLSAAEVGLLFGTGTIVALLLGQIGAGAVADIAGQRDIRAYMWVIAISSAIALPFGLLFVFSDNRWAAIIGFSLFYLFLSPFNLCCITMGQTLVPPRMRAMAATVQGLFQTFVGFGVVPPLIGWSNDMLTARYGEQAIRYSMGLTVMIALFIIGFSLLGAIWLRGDYAKLHGGGTDEATN